MRVEDLKIQPLIIDIMMLKGTKFFFASLKRLHIFTSTVTQRIQHQHPMLVNRHDSGNPTDWSCSQELCCPLHLSLGFFGCSREVSMHNERVPLTIICSATMVFKKQCNAENMSSDYIHLKL